MSKAPVTLSLPRLLSRTGKVLCALHSSSSKQFSRMAMAQQQHLWGAKVLSQRTLHCCAGKQTISCASWRSPEVPGRSVPLGYQSCPVPAAHPDTPALNGCWPAPFHTGDVSGSSSCRWTILPSSSRLLGHPASPPERLCVSADTLHNEHLFSNKLQQKTVFAFCFSVSSCCWLLWRSHKA